MGCTAAGCGGWPTCWAPPGCGDVPWTTPRCGCCTTSTTWTRMPRLGERRLRAARPSCRWHGCSGRLSRVAESGRVLVACVGNVLRGDDGFGQAVEQRLLASGGLPPGVDLIETGIGGLGIVQQLMQGYD